MATAQTTISVAAEAPRRGRAGALTRALGLALAPMLLFLSIPVGLAGGFVLAWCLLVASLVLVTLDAALFGRAR
ncbi:hypothetical protein [Salinarimonas ramus]|uniref:Uncharacterized protein n=1 Tax=Salinarimonas ramus TaxID=690164 RepID=A0A917V2B9_9HYPH|nr:hypothetical protein [Salinarimonas ramus]GGK22514.1 hypothetical protein GCM10011322_06480 [Salinarimonas ramus]